MVVNEDIAFCRAFQDRMQKEYFDVTFVQSKMKALDIFLKQKWCLVILDVQTLDEEQINMLHIMHSTNHIPILALVPDMDKEGKIALFHAGANACLDKTADLEVCVAQANALIQVSLESIAGKQNIISFGAGIVINPRYRQIFVDGEPLELTRKEFDLLHYLASNQRQVFSRKQLYDQIWNDGLTEGGEETVRVHLSTLRKKLMSMNKDLIKNVRGVGYCFVPPSEI